MGQTKEDVIRMVNNLKNVEHTINGKTIRTFDDEMINRVLGVLDRLYVEGVIVEVRKEHWNIVMTFTGQSEDIDVIFTEDTMQYDIIDADIMEDVIESNSVQYALNNMFLLMIASLRKKIVKAKYGSIKQLKAS